MTCQATAQHETPILKSPTRWRREFEIWIPVFGFSSDLGKRVARHSLLHDRGNGFQIHAGLEGEVAIKPVFRLRQRSKAAVGSFDVVSVIASITSFSAPPVA
jgi:hypothetical protein